MPSSPCNQREPSGNKQANQLSVVTARKENAIKMTAVLFSGVDFAHRATLRGQPRAGDDASRGLQGAIQHNSSCSAGPEITADNKGRNCAHALGTVRLCSSARICVLCALIVHCANPPPSCSCVSMGCPGAPAVSPAVGVAAGEPVLGLKRCFRPCLSCRAPGRAPMLCHQGAWAAGVLFPPAQPKWKVFGKWT